MMIDLVGVLGQVPAYGVYAVVGTAVLAESILLVGAVVPTFTLVVTGGAMARYGHVNLILLISIAALAVVIGDFLAYRTGRTLNRRPLTERLFRRVPAQILRRAEALILHHGGPAVLASRFIPVVRTLTPHLVGMSDLPYRKMAMYSTVGALVWATAEATLGYMAAASLHQATTLGVPALVALSALIVAAVATTRWALHRNTSTEPFDTGHTSLEGEGIGSAIVATIENSTGVDPRYFDLRQKAHRDENMLCDIDFHINT